MTLANTSLGKKVYLVAGKRTPFGKFGGSLKNISGLDLALAPSRALLDSLDIDPKLIDQVSEVL